MSSTKRKVEKLAIDPITEHVDPENESTATPVEKQK